MCTEETPSTTALLHVSLGCMQEVDLLPHLDGTERGLVVMMCGLPGSGKSTYARVLERRGYTRLSIDEVVWARIGRDAVDLDPAEYRWIVEPVSNDG